MQNPVVLASQTVGSSLAGVVASPSEATPIATVEVKVRSFVRNSTTLLLPELRSHQDHQCGYIPGYHGQVSMFLLSSAAPFRRRPQYPVGRFPSRVLPCCGETNGHVVSLRTLSRESERQSSTYMSLFLSNMQRAGLRDYLSCLEHPAAGRVVHLCLKNIAVRDMNSQVIRHLPHDRLVVAGQDNV